MDPIKPKKTLVEETYDVLIDAICAREFEPGERLNQDGIAARLNVSRQPVNSAIAILRTNGLVEDTGRRGVVVSRVDPDFFRSVYEYRLTIEPLAVRLALERKPATARQEAATVLEAGQAAVASGDMRMLQNADRGFHEMLYRWSRNQVIETSMRTNWHHIRRAMAEVLRYPDHVAQVWREHGAILEAILEGDAKAAVARMDDHIRVAYGRTFKGAEPLL